MLNDEHRARWLRDALVRLAMASSLAVFACSAGGCAAASRYPSASYAAPAPSSPQQSLGMAPGSAAEATVTTASVAENEGGSYGDSDGESARGGTADEEAPPPEAPAAQQPAGPGRPAGPVPRTAPPPPPATRERAAVAMNAGNRGPGGNTNNGPGTNTAQPGTSPQPAAVQAPMLIYVAEVQMQTPRAEISATIERVIEAATSIGGYLVRRTDDMVQVRVPSLRFRESLARVETFGEVLHRSVSADDVSEEYRDIEVRLQNLRAVRRRLEEFLARANSMTDALTVERELERVTREIDTLEGRLRFLGARVAFSLVTVRVQPRPDHVDVAAPEPSATRRLLNLPVEWISRLGLERLMDVGSHE